MKTVYIPAGATYNYETLVTDDVIVHGHLHFSLYPRWCDLQL